MKSSVKNLQHRLLKSNTTGAEYSFSAIRSGSAEANWDRLKVQVWINNITLISIPTADINTS